MSRIKNLFKFIFLVLIFSILMNITLANSECRFNVSGPKALVLDNCNIIETREGDNLTINFTKCKVLAAIDDGKESNDDGPLYDIPSPHGRRIDNVIIYNEDNSFQPITYKLFISCENTPDLRLKIKVYPHNYFVKLEPPLPPTLCTFKDWECSEWYPEKCHETKKQTRGCALVNIKCLNSEVVKPSTNQNCTYVPPSTNCNPTIIGNQGTVNVNCGNGIVTNNNFIVNFLVKFRVKIITSITLISISIGVIELYYFIKRKNKKHKKK